MVFSSQDSTELQAAYNLMIEKRWMEAKDDLLRLFDGHDPIVAKYLGYVFSQQGSGFCDKDASLKYYSLSASAGDFYAQKATACLLRDKGEKEKALVIFQKCKLMDDDAEFHYAGYRLCKDLGNADADIFLKGAAERGHPMATQKLSTLYIRGKFGVSKILPGMKMYVANIGSLVRYVKETVK